MNRRRPELRKSSAPEAVASGRRGVVWLKLVLSSVTLLSSVLVCFFCTYRFVQTSPRFAVREINVAGNHQLSAAEVVAFAGLEHGTNIFAADLGGARTRLIAVPWIREARVERRLPNTLRVVVSEREVVALAPLGQALYLISERGEPFKQLEAGDPHDLPLITGLSEQGLALDRERELERVVEAVGVLRQYENLPLSRSQVVQELELGPSGGLSLVVGQAGMTWRLGKGPWHGKLARATRALKSLTNRGEEPRILFLDNQRHPERVVARLR
jgi:cell division protein FtsQ